MVVYLDVLFAVNALINTLLLHAACLFAGRQPQRVRLILAGVLGGVYAAVAALPQMGFLVGWCGKGMCGAAMILIAFGWSRQTIRLAVWFAMLSAAFAGVVLMLTGLFGIEVYMLGGTAVYPISLPTLVLTAGISYCVIALLLQRFGKHSAADMLKPITICIAGRRRQFTALMDTGNLLRDPMTGREVFVLDGTCTKELLPQLSAALLSHPAEAFAALAGSVAGLRLIPYRAVGTSSGLLLGIKSDWVLVGEKKIPGATVAFSPSPVSGGAYQVIAGGN